MREEINMDRVTAFNGLTVHPMLGRVFNKLTSEERALCRDFLAQHEALDKGEFELLVNRMFLDVGDKPMRWKEITELLACANSKLP